MPTHAARGRARAEKPRIVVGVSQHVVSLAEQAERRVVGAEQIGDTGGQPDALPNQIAAVQVDDGPSVDWRKQIGFVAAQIGRGAVGEVATDGRTSFRHRKTGPQRVAWDTRQRAAGRHEDLAVHFVRMVRAAQNERRREAGSKERVGRDPNEDTAPASRTRSTRVRRARVADVLEVTLVGQRAAADEQDVVLVHRSKDRSRTRSRRPRGRARRLRSSAPRPDRAADRRRTRSAGGTDLRDPRSRARRASARATRCR